MTLAEYGRLDDQQGREDAGQQRYLGLKHAMHFYFKALALGIPGIVSIILTVTPPDGVPALLLAVNPLVLLLLCAMAGLWAAPRVGLRSTIILADALPARVLFGFAVAGIVAGLLIAVLDHWAAPFWNPGTVRSLRQRGGLHDLPVNLLYGGITEEIIFRWGLMASLVAGAMRFFPRHVAIWMGVGLSAFLFACAHLPAVALEAGALTGTIAARTLLWNALLGFFFGAAFAKGGLEAAIAAHVSFHLGVVIANQL
jgi:hypothetical protein